MWQKDWILGKCYGLNCRQNPEDKKKLVTLVEKDDGSPWKAKGKEQGAYHDFISPESRTIIQQFSVGGQRIQVVLGLDGKGGLVTTWDVKIVVRFPDAPVYSAVP